MKCEEWDYQGLFLYMEGRLRLPHVVLTGDATRIDLSQTLVPVSEEKETWFIKVDDIYVERRGARALMRTVVVEEGHPQTFYILVAKDDTENRLIIRLDPSTDPIKTRGVKRSIAVVAEELMRCRAGFSVERHNITGYLDSAV